MASCQSHPQVEYQSPQPSTSGYSLPEMVDDEVPGPSAPWVDLSPPHRFFYWKRTREWSDQSEEEPEEEPEKSRAPEPEDTWVVESLHWLKMKLKQRQVSPMLPEHHGAFNRLLEDPVVKRFLAWDKDLRVSDKYLLAMVIAYFSCAGLFSWQYRRVHFFWLCDYLANDREEDNQAPKQDILYFLYEKNRSQRPLFHKLQLQFVCSIWRRWVKHGEVEEVGRNQAYDPEHWVWARDCTLLPRAPGLWRPEVVSLREGTSASFRIKAEYCGLFRKSEEPNCLIRFQAWATW
uniref:speedy protein E4-like n=1 Tax=Callithrix jacchus TaxID=9483 RepID=UPI0023DD2BC3|nr:speedy protein E4-like [Callithrix jacchus]